MTSAHKSGLRGMFVSLLLIAVLSISTVAGAKCTAYTDTLCVKEFQQLPAGPNEASFGSFRCQRGAQYSYGQCDSVHDNKDVKKSSGDCISAASGAPKCFM